MSLSALHAECSIDTKYYMYYLMLNKIPWAPKWATIRCGPKESTVGGTDPGIT